MFSSHLELASRIEVEGIRTRPALPSGFKHRLTIGSAADLKLDPRIQSGDRLPMQTIAAGSDWDLDGSGNIVPLILTVVDVTGIHHGIQMDSDGGDVVHRLQ